MLSLVAKKLREGGEVPVRLQEEPKNPVDSRAIAFQCQVHENWERIGYVVREALDSVHAAMDSGDILKKFFLLGEVQCILKIIGFMQAF